MPTVTANKQSDSDLLLLLSTKHKYTEFASQFHNDIHKAISLTLFFVCISTRYAIWIKKQKKKSDATLENIHFEIE